MSYKAVFHVDLENNQLFTLALGNITNTLIATEGTEREFILLANGPGVAMLAGNLVIPYLEQIKALQDAGVRFQVCNNALKKFAVSQDSLAAGVEIIPAGIVGLIDLQNSGWAYIKP